MWLNYLFFPPLSTVPLVEVFQPSNKHSFGLGKQLLQWVCFCLVTLNTDKKGRLDEAFSWEKKTHPNPKKLEFSPIASSKASYYSSGNIWVMKRSRPCRKVNRAGSVRLGPSGKWVPSWASCFRSQSKRPASSSCGQLSQACTREFIPWPSVTPRRSSDVRQEPCGKEASIIASMKLENFTDCTTTYDIKNPAGELFAYRPSGKVGNLCTWGASLCCCCVCCLTFARVCVRARMCTHACMCVFMCVCVSVCVCSCFCRGWPCPQSSPPCRSAPSSWLSYFSPPRPSSTVRPAHPCSTASLSR